tara:strand:- start:70 stop:462 length:393 start_codon:yes stop_codon:yes gene_type:complete
MNVQAFVGDLDKFAKKTEINIETVVRKIAFEIYIGVTKKTPVDTGRAKANWNIGTGSIDFSINENATSTAQGSAGRLTEPRKGTGNKVIYISNNLPYINALENGSSEKAPNGMVSLTMNEMNRMVKNVIR